MIQALLLVLALAPVPQAVTYKVSGTVVREDKQDPAAAVRSNQILLRGSSFSTVINVGAGGAFEFPRVAPGSYTLMVGPQTVMMAVAVTVSDMDVTGVRLLVPPSPGVTGTIAVDGDGPRPRFQVEFARTDGANTPIAVPAPFNLTVPAGEYHISATGLPAGYSLKSIRMGDKDFLGQTFTAVSSPQMLVFTLAVSSPPPWVHVSGHVTGGTASTQVSLAGGAMAESTTIPVGPNGVFDFAKIIPGTYTARTLPGSNIAPPIPVTVGAEGLSNLEIRIPVPKQVNGRVILRGNGSVPRLAFTIANPGVVPPPPAQAGTVILNGVIVTASGGATVTTVVQSDGTFKVTLPDGEHQLSIVPTSLPGGYIVDSFSYGSTDLLKNPVRIAAGDTAELALALDATQVKPHNISGKATNLLTTKGVRVVLQGGNLGTGVESPVAEDGSFSFADILPGMYSARLSLSGQVISTSINLGNADATNVVINYPRQFSVIARVIVEGDGPTPVVPSASLQAISTSGKTVTASTNASEPALLTISDGGHNVSLVRVPEGYRLKSIMYGDIDLQKQPLKIDGPINWEIIVRLVKI